MKRFGTFRGFHGLNTFQQTYIVLVVKYNINLFCINSQFRLFVLPFIDLLAHFVKTAKLLIKIDEECYFFAFFILLIRVC